MRDNIEIDGVGKVLLAKPNSLVAISDVVAEWGGQKSRAKLSRIIAAAIGLSWSKENTIKAPLYDVKEGDVVGYGGEVMEFLLKRGVAPSDLYLSASSIIPDLILLLPTAKEVSKAEEFFQEEGKSGQDDSQHRAGVE
tara:strand:+ start:18573 stop:18986 length:414 start_codon:yes stop_codon:yes gene_type:complete